MSAFMSIAQAQANSNIHKKTTKTTKKKKKRKRSRPASLVEMTSFTQHKKDQKRDKKSSSSSSSSSSSTNKRRKVTPSKSSKASSSTKDIFNNTTESLKIIGDYHTLNKRISQNENDASIDATERTKRRQTLLQEQKTMGGIDVYQKASMYGAKASKFVCADWVEPLLRQYVTKETTRPKVLDVGAIDNQYIDRPWINAVPIDLNAQHPSVTQIDFFDYAHNHVTEKLTSSTSSSSSTSSTASTSSTSSSSSNQFDAVIMSLVLNFQGDPRKRGDMLAHVPSLLKNGGLFFIALPSASLDNSRYCDEKHFIQIIKSLGFQLIEQKRSTKLILLSFTVNTTLSNKARSYDTETKTFQYNKEMPRKLIRADKKGEKRNNFAVMLKNKV